MEQKTDWHKIEIDDLIKNLNSSKDGLTQEEARSRFDMKNPNSIIHEKNLTSWGIFLGQFRSPLIYFLALAGIVTVLMRDYSDAIVIFAAVVLNSFVGFLQENKASKALTALRKILKVKAVVLRDGVKKEILQDELVQGDIIILKAGDKIPADGRIIESRDFKVSEAILTGESSSVNKENKILVSDLVISDRTNMVYMGTLVEYGSAKVIVTDIGRATEMGKIAKLVKDTKDEKTPYQKKISDLSRLVAIIIVSMAALIFILGLLEGKPFIEMFTTSVAVAVAAVPEGLPIAMTVVLALGMQRILKRNGLVRRLSAAEALGSTTIICVDKTGTLTEGEMVVSHIYSGRDEMEFNGEKNILDKTNNPIHVEALEIAGICADTYIENYQDEMKDWIIRGRPTDRALSLAAIQAGVSSFEIEKKYPVLDTLDFNSDAKYSASLNKTSEDANTLFVLGAPEKILNFSKFIKVEGTTEKIDEKKLDDLTQKFQSLTSKGLRVIATAYKETKENTINNPKDLFSDLVFVGFIALKDPLRAEVKEAIKIAINAGLKPVIVTGDHRLTAQAIARELGLPTEDENIIEGEELKNMSEVELCDRIENIEIFARVEPAQKLKIVESFQSLGEIVAMTGDGINDAPALKKADIGLALGSGTEVAKEVSDLVLLSDNFSVIVSAIEEGRAIIDNIRKSIVYLISDAFSEVSLILVSLLMGWPLPVLAAQILWIKLIEDGLPTITLAFEKKESDLMQRKPYGKDYPLIDRDMKILMAIIAAFTVLSVSALYYYLQNYTGYELSSTRTIIFATLVICTLFNVFSCKSLRQNIWHINPFSNLYLLASWLFGVVALIAAIYIPFLQELLRTEPLSLGNWVTVAILGVINIAMVEFTKLVLIVRNKNGK